MSFCLQYMISTITQEGKVIESSFCCRYYMYLFPKQRKDYILNLSSIKIKNAENKKKKNNNNNNNNNNTY